ncbi:MAG TPA: GspE/PulE family protein [bacterium]|mgnify:CR=1 FL=1|jgi:general secretion pathway protein E|nr:type II/IV secretion system protein [bacterium]MDX9805533.1 GspE/PulE family protein [bacterium]HPM46879.1 GspE/PulE family protein [bacterium]HPV20203.1 GspE/PulE family protein [bacterium]HPY15493.1 GspE/PulE family protein [bacterium]
MKIELSLSLLLEMLEEYSVINKEQKELISARKDYYQSMFETTFKRAPFVTELLVFTCEKESIKLSEEQLLRLIAARAGCEYVVIDPLKIDNQLTVKTISAAYGKINRVIPLYKTGDDIVLAMADPFRMDIIDQLSTSTSSGIIPVVASAKDIERVLADLFGFKKSIKAAADDLVREGFNNLENLTDLGKAKNMDDKHIINAVDYMLKYAIDQEASDIHIEPKRDETNIRFRLDGILHTIYSFPFEAHLPFVSRLKMLAKMDIAEKRRPQDGRIKVVTETGLEVELRASTVPVVTGEKMVLRVLESSTFVKDINNIGFSDEQKELYDVSLKKGYGMVLVTGPTGSGKSTTLYSTLKWLASPEINVVSVEDPIEIIIDEINQMGVNVKAGITFSSALRHILRQDPDIVMIGEIRDKETATNAVQAALTGHLVLSTLHTNDTATTIERIGDLGIEPYLIASVLNAIVAQRLVRKVCPFCSFLREMSEEEKITLHLPLESTYKIRDAEGCVKCRYTGYKGRTAIIEFMNITPKMRSIISEGATADEIRNNAIMDGMLTLKESAIRKLADGVTTFDEIVKALYYE